MSHLKKLAYSEMKEQVHSSTAPVHRMFLTLFIDSAPWDAGLLPDEEPSALRHHACTQNATDVMHSFRILGCWPTPGWRSKCSQAPHLRTECIGCHSQLSHLERLAYSQMEGQVLKHCNCTQNVSQVIQIFRILGCWSTPRCRSKCSQAPRLHMEGIRFR